MTKILLVEDDKSLREIYGVRLLAEGYDIVSAGDGEEALAMAIKERPQLIVSDVMMPKISGFDMLDILRSTTETKAIKVIMMTALSSDDQRARGEALGADRYLVKSQVGIEDVVRTVHDVLGDALTSGTSPAAFGSASTPSATPRPAPTMSSTPRPTTPSAPVAMPSPTVPPTAASAPQVQPRPAAPVSPTLAPQPASGLPQPTAPFSTNRPASLGERVIHPISTPQASTSAPDLGSLIDQELGKLNEQPQQAPVAAPIPVSPIPVPQPVAPPVPAPVAPPAPTEEPQLVIPPLPPTPPAPVSQPPVLQNSAITFEETPRPPVPPAQSAS
jgi:CheY-like chemotaxis protein